jgi:SPP1 gp7 family putative phage head morphogenesis protein
LKGRRASEIADDIRSRFSTGNKANVNLIARTEVSKTSTALTRARSEEIGLNCYIWRTSEDQRVRKSHDHMDGVIVFWRYPPSPEQLAGERSVGYYHAGEIFNCRCYPEPLISINDVQWPHKVYISGRIQSMTKSQFAALAGMKQAETPKHKPKQIEPKPETTKPQLPKQVEQKNTYTSAKNIKEAEAYCRSKLNIPNVNLSDFDLQAANDIAEHFSKLQELYPEVFIMKKLSSCQTLYKDVYEKELAYRIEEYTRMGYNRSRAEELAKKHTKRRRLEAGTVALSNKAKNEFNGISFNQKFYKTAKGYEELKGLSKQQANVGYWSHDSMNGTITHEFGHQVMDYLDSKSMSTPIREAFKKFRQEVINSKDGIQGYRDLLSEYANTNVREFFAEAFREYMDSDSPRKFAKMIGQIVENAFGNLRRRN